MAKPFLKRKLLERIHFHENIEKLHEIFDKGILPFEIGDQLELKEAINQKIVKELLKN